MIKISIYIFIFILGAVIGSFLNVCIYRIPLEESIAYPPSHCTNCNAKLKWYELIPILSYFFLRGKCKHCGEKISIKYPMIEILTGILFLLTYMKYDLSIHFIKYSIFFSFLIIIFIIDLNTQDVYAITTVPGIALGIVFSIIEKTLYSAPLWNYILGAGIAGGIIVLIVYVIGGMGEGDIEIAVFCGIFIGWKYSILMIILSFIIGAIIGVTLIIFKKKSKKDYIPFGPFIALSSFIVVFYGSYILNYYLNLFM